MKVLGPVQVHGSQPGRSFLASLRKVPYPFIVGGGQFGGVLLPDPPKVGLLNPRGPELYPQPLPIKGELAQMVSSEAGLVGLTRGGALYYPQGEELVLPGGSIKKILPQGRIIFCLDVSGSLWEVLSPTNQPRLVAEEVSDFSVGMRHLLVLKTSGEIWGQGDNRFGQLGEGVFQDLRPTTICGDFVLVCCGAYHSFALKKDGSLWGWGNNHYGQLGNGSTLQRNYPTRVLLQEVPIQISSSLHTLALDQRGQVWSWGCNRYGQLGRGDSEDRSIPGKIGGFYYSGYSAFAYSLLWDQEGVFWIVGSPDGNTHHLQPIRLDWERL